MGNEQCQNCNAPLRSDQKFCSNCGQKADIHRISWHELSHDVVHYFTHADKGIFGLIKDLATKTGLVAKEYLSGKRKRYFSPINFFLIVAALYLISFSYFYKHTIKYINPTTVQADTTNNAANESPLSVAQKERAEKAQAFLLKRSNWLAISSLPFTSFIFWLFYRRKGYKFLEHVVANMYMTAFTLLIVSILMLACALLFPQLGFYVMIPVMLLQVVYYAVFYFRFVDGKGTKAWLKSSIAAISSILLWAVVTNIFINLYVLKGFDV